LNKSVLILAYKFTPYEGIGARRWTKFVKYLSKENINVIVITNNWKIKGPNSWIEDLAGRENVKIIKLQSPFNNLKSKNKLLNKIVLKIELTLSLNFRWTDEAYLFYSFNYKTIKKIINENRIVNIIATGGPFSSNFFASKLKKQDSNLNLIQDFRDLWMEEYFFEHPTRTNEHPFYLKEKEMEIFTLQNSDVIISVTPGCLSRLKDKCDSLNVLNRKYELIENGYDEDDKIIFNINDYPFDVFNNKFLNICHFGTADFGRENEFISFLKDIKTNLIDERKIVFHFFGNNPQRFKTEIKIMGLDEKVVFHKFYPPKQIQKFMFFSDIHLVINDPVYYYAFGTKVFDALLYRKPIMLICKEDVLYDIIKLNKLGIVTNNTKTQNLKGFSILIKNFISIKNNEFINYNFDFNRFSIKNLTREYIKLLK
jgi:hypothetical protein